MNTYNGPSTAVEILAAILCSASDIPAARILCGFLAIVQKETTIIKRTGVVLMSEINGKRLSKQH